MLSTPVLADLFLGLTVIFFVILERLEKLVVSVARFSNILPKRRHRRSQLVHGGRLTSENKVIGRQKTWVYIDQKPYLILENRSNSAGEIGTACE